MIKMKNQQSLYTIQASKLKTLLSLIGLTLFQIGGYFYLASAEGYSFVVLIMFFVLLALFLIETVLLIHFLKQGLPKVEFYADECFIQIYTLNIHIPYREINALNFNKQKQICRYIPYGYDYQLLLYFTHEQNEHNLFHKKTKLVKEFLIASQFVFLDRQILEMSIIFYSICPMSSEPRQLTLNNLNRKLVNYEQLISSNELDNFKDNQYLSKYFRI